MVISIPVNTIASHAFQEIYVLIKLGEIIEFSTTGSFGLYFCFLFCLFFMVKNLKLGQ